jgi:Acetyltransferases, including N-acetylases of ribosomal proteins
MIVFETERLSVRYLEDSDFDAFYALNATNWGQGLATEFVRGMLNAGFLRWNLPRIEASIDPQNIASLRVVQKVGMNFVRSGVDEHNFPTEYYALDNPASRASSPPG